MEDAKGALVRIGIHVDLGLVPYMSKMIEKLINFPKSEFVFRSYLLKGTKLDAVKAKFSREL